MLSSQLHLQLLSLFILAQVWLSVSQFVFELELDPRSVTADFNCADGLGDSAECTTYFSIFCLREGRDTRSTSEGDCPLGTSGRLNAFDVRLSSPQIRRITSPRPWPVSFQLYIKARDSDGGLIVDLINGDDDLDDIFIDRTLEVSSNFTELEAYTGVLNRVTIQMRFRVLCQQDYYGADCSIFCVAQDDDVNGHYTCNSDGSLQCLEGFTNPRNNCRDTINPCDSSPCATSGSCVPGMGPLGVDYTCQCVAGYTGPRCEVNIDDCQSAVCPNNSMCVDGVNSYQCICFPDLELDAGGRCISTSLMENQELYGLAVAVTLIVTALIVLSVVLIIVTIKCQRLRRKKIQRMSQAGTPDLIINNSMCDGNSASFQAAKDGGTLRNVQNPIYGGDTAHDDRNNSASRPPKEHLYAIVKTADQELLTSADSLPGETPGTLTEHPYDYAAVSGASAPPEYAHIEETISPGERTVGEEPQLCQESRHSQEHI